MRDVENRLKESLGGKMDREGESYVLIVDDNPVNLQVLGTILRDKNFRTAVAGDGIQALKLVKKRLPDLILLDVMMPEMDGFEVCETLKRSPRTREIPVIFLTAKSEPSDIIRGFEVGGADYITKPFNSAELLARINNHLEMLRVSNERRQLLHVLCHDLANPFSSIVSSIKMIRDGYADFDVLEGYIYTSAINGLRVIDLVREIRALEEKKVSFQLKSVPLKQVIEESSIMLSQKFMKKRVSLVTDVDSELTVCAEYTSLLNAVINNIFTNAIKFSFPDSEITVWASQDDENVTLTVKDAGIGMSGRLQQDLFDMRKNTSRAGTGGEIGTGFGMPLVRKFVRLYGGAIEVFSKEERDEPENHGTEIRLTFKKGNLPSENYRGETSHESFL